MEMKTIFIEAKYNEDLILPINTIKYLKKFKSIAIYSAVQFQSSIKNIIKQLNKEGIKAVTSIPKRATKEGQILGCDCYAESLNLKTETDAYFYIGDGSFHPNALILAQKDSKSYKEVIVFDPAAKAHKVLSLEECSAILKKYKGTMMKFLNAENIGVMISTKTGQMQLKLAQLVEKKYSSKKVYKFIGDNFDLRSLENFPFVNVWLNTACPRIGLDDGVMYHVSVINADDALNAEKLLSQDSILTRS
jgi:diphthamide biosynthesis enzyme Dph1/Dph2-like protein